MILVLLTEEEKVKSFEPYFGVHTFNNFVEQEVKITYFRWG